MSVMVELSGMVVEVVRDATMNRVTVSSEKNGYDDTRRMQPEPTALPYTSLHSNDRRTSGNLKDCSWH